MTDHGSNPPDDHGAFSDRELPDRSDMDDGSDDGEPTMPCPYCKAIVYEDAEICTHCGSYISEEDAPLRLPTWMIVGLVLTFLILVFGWIL